MSIFAEPVNVDDEEFSTDDEQATAADNTTTTTTNEQATGEWSVDEKRALLKAIEAQLPPADDVSYTRRLKTLDWALIQVAGRTEQQNKLQLMQLLKKIRHVRSLTELFGDVHAVLDKPTLPRSKNAYILFCAEFRARRPDLKLSVTELAQRFRELSAEERSVYDDAANAANSENKPERKRKELLRELDAQLGTPFNLFCRAELAQGKYVKQQMRSDFARLTDEEKLPFVRSALEQAQAAGVDSFSVLTTKEIRMLKTQAQTKPLTAYNLFVREFYANGAGNATLVGASHAYKELSTDAKRVLQERAAAISGADVPEPKVKSKSKKAAAATETTATTPTTKAAKKPTKSKLTAANGMAGQPTIESLLTPLKKRTDAVDGASGSGSAKLLLHSPRSVPALDSGRKRKSNGGDATTVLADGLTPPTANSTRRSIKMESSSETDSASKKRKSIKEERTRIPEPERVPK